MMTSSLTVEHNNW